MKPIIGITANFIKDGRFGVDAHIGGAGQFWQALADDYIRSVVLAGGTPVIVPIVSGEEASSYLEGLDGLIISGGCDASPLTFGADTTGAVGEICTERDELELELLRKALDMPGFPVLGICRGCQLINIALGGNVYQDLPSENPQCTIRHSQGAPGGYPTHHVDLQPGSSLYETLGARAFVNSRHHQAIHRVAEGLEVTAEAPDGVAESVESHDHRQVVAVQWHPENMWQEHPEMEQLFADFLKRVEEMKKEG